MEPFRQYARRHSRTVWLLTVGRLIDQTTLWMAVPFLSIFISRAGASVTTTGLVIALNPMAQVLGNLVGGQWSDRHGRRPVILAAMGFRVFVLLGFAFATTVWQFAVLSFCNGLVGALFNPAYTAAIADATPPAQRADAFGLSRVMSNLGVGLGPLLGSALGIEAKTLVFCIAAASSAAVCTGFFLHLRETLAPTGAPAPSGSRLRQTVESWGTIFADKALLVFIAGGVLSQIAYGQINSSLPLYLKATMPGYERVYGLIWTLNGIVVVILQLPVTAAFRRSSMALASAVGCATFAIGYLLFGLAGSALALHAATVVWTLGEITLAVPNTTFVTDIAPAPLRGRYVGASALERALGGIAAPILGTAVLGAAGGRAVMFGAAVCVGVAGVFFQAAERQRSRRLTTSATF